MHFIRTIDLLLDYHVQILSCGSTANSSLAFYFMFTLFPLRSLVRGGALFRKWVVSFLSTKNITEE